MECKSLARTGMACRELEFSAYVGKVTRAVEQTAPTAAHGKPPARREQVLLQSAEQGMGEEVLLEGHDLMLGVGSDVAVAYACSASGAKLPVAVHNRNTNYVSRLAGATVITGKPWFVIASVLFTFATAYFWRHLRAPDGLDASAAIGLVSSGLVTLLAVVGSAANETAFRRTLDEALRGLSGASKGTSA